MLLLCSLPIVVVGFRLSWLSSSLFIVCQTNGEIVFTSKIFILDLRMFDFRGVAWSIKKKVRNGHLTYSGGQERLFSYC